ncbi:hypothetical protein G3M58_85925 [Streptomyces sp. SID7499]|uniref:Uncharacterized protein n=1 Tax=Streptomyces sp. SID7499 TaxID=2706086 RepID=A0A6G3XUU2_9ACTN|nr:hypothetical protein [Streptomyces sp. SID7499]
MLSIRHLPRLFPPDYQGLRNQSRSFCDSGLHLSRVRHQHYSQLGFVDKPPRDATPGLTLFGDGPQLAVVQVSAEGVQLGQGLLSRGSSALLQEAGFGSFLLLPHRRSLMFLLEPSAEQGTSGSHHGTTEPDEPDQDFRLHRLPTS